MIVVLSVTEMRWDDLGSWMHINGSHHTGLGIVAFATAMRLYLTKNDGAPSLSRRRLFG